MLLVTTSVDQNEGRFSTLAKMKVSLFFSTFVLARSWNLFDVHLQISRQVLHIWKGLRIGFFCIWIFFGISDFWTTSSYYSCMSVTYSGVFRKLNSPSILWLSHCNMSGMFRKLKHWNILQTYSCNILQRFRKLNSLVILRYRDCNIWRC